MAEETLLVLSTFPDGDSARRIARELVSAHTAACANLLPRVHSVYRWKEKVEEAEETLAFFKTTRARFPELQAQLKALHPYAVPEIIALPLAEGLPEYFRWVAESCAPPSDFDAASGSVRAGPP